MWKRLNLSVEPISRTGAVTIFAGAIAFLLYAATAAPSIVELYDDSLEFQLVGPAFGLAHPTGYPLYTILGGLWSRFLVPLNNWAWRMNLFSAAAGAAAVALVFRLSVEICRSHWAGIVAAVAFGLGPIWWRQTTVAEVYALHGLFIVLILLAAVRYTAARDADRAAALWPLFLLLGLSLTHHRTSLLIFPALAVYLLWRVPHIWRPRRAWVTWALTFLAPLLLYLYLPLRAGMGVSDLQGDYINTWNGFWDHVLARRYSGFFAENPLAVDRTLQDWFYLFQKQIGWLGIGLGGAGLVAGLADEARRPEWFLVLLTLLINVTFAASYRVADAEVFALPAFLGLSLFAGRGAGLVHNAILDATNRLLHGSGRVAELSQSLPGLTVAGLVTLLILSPGSRREIVDRSRDWAVHDYAVEMAKVSFPSGSKVLGLQGQVTALIYMQQAEGLGQEANPIALDDPERRRLVLDAAVGERNPIYLTQELDGIANRYSFGGFGPLVRVWPRGEAVAGTPSVRTDMALSDGDLRLLGYDLAILEQAGGTALRTAFYWLPTVELQQTLKLSLRLQTRNGEAVQNAAPVVIDSFPLRQVAPTESWLPGEVIRDVHYLEVPSGPLATGQQLLVIIYDAVSLNEVSRFTIDLPPLGS